MTRPRPLLCAILALVWALAAPAGEQPHATPADDLPEILVSRQLAEAGRLEVGDVVGLSAERPGAETRAFRVAGTYEPTPDPVRLTARRQEVRLHLGDLLALTGDPYEPQSDESVAAINVALVDPREAGAFAADLTARMPQLVVREATPSVEDARTFVVLERFHRAIAAVSVLGSTAFLFALMILRVDERRETVGILRLVGLSRRRILLQVLLEGLVLAVAGATAGVLFAAGMEGVFNRFFQWWYDTSFVFVEITAPIAWRSVALAVPLGTLAGLVASWALLRSDIVALLRR